MRISVFWQDSRSQNSLDTEVFREGDLAQCPVAVGERKSSILISQQTFTVINQQCLSSAKFPFVENQGTRTRKLRIRQKLSSSLIDSISLAQIVSILLKKAAGRP
jgi:hypothetical protein